MESPTARDMLQNCEFIEVNKTFMRDKCVA